ncbi:uncharacterized protein K452DRAFT_351182 [Aplosporella prunicola CBS 121167]|uniref:Cytochrome P450 n=1 Tax=Aplosporella prunicola CBS 121167 TaxID=1176127 RepID=A0A6A6BDY3_9PEZI|nr:uncharacterized protein K452DRAFT_351182 [Aplosporella prunicola CBS 121167]KAF2141603.1 hypothetical protein K452DRAFT_351182 [Aplosporella prunicola CBS 121167]
MFGFWPLRNPLIDWDVELVLITTVITSLLFFILFVAYNCFLHPIAHIPGPFVAKTSPLWAMRALYRRRFNSELQELHQKYGPAVRIGPNEVSFATLEAETAIYAKQEDGRFSKKGTFLTLFSDLVLNAPTLITIPDPALHKKLHRTIQQAFTPEAFAKQEPIQNQHIDQAFVQLESDCRNGKTINLTLTLETMFWEIIGDLSFGEPLMSGKKPVYEALKELGKSTMPMVELLSYLTTLPGVPELLQSISSLISALPFQSQLSKLVPSTRLRDCMERQDGREDFLTAIMSSEKQGLSLNADALFSNAMGLTLAGYQTTATTLVATLYHILGHPGVYNQLCHEIRSGFTEESEITGKQLLRLPLLNACVHETLRLLPPANGKTAQRTAPDCFIGEIRVPAGTLVSADLYSIQRSEEYFHNPSAFHPERWINNGRETSFEGDKRLAYRPFLIGSRACIGRNMAQNSIRLILARLFWRYDLELLNKNFVWERDAGSSLIYTDYELFVRAKKVR